MQGFWSAFFQKFFQPTIHSEQTESSKTGFYIGIPVEEFWGEEHLFDTAGAKVSLWFDPWVIENPCKFLAKFSFLAVRSGHLPNKLRNFSSRKKQGLVLWLIGGFCVEVQHMPK